LSEESDWTSERIPKAQEEHIKKIIKAHPELGFRSVPEFLRASVRDKILQVRIMELKASEKEGATAA